LQYLSAFLIPVFRYWASPIPGSQYSAGIKTQRYARGVNRPILDNGLWKGIPETDIYRCLEFSIKNATCLFNWYLVN